MTDTDSLRSTWLGRVAEAEGVTALEEVRLAALGKKGEIALMMRELGRMTPRGAPDHRRRPEPRA